MKFEQSLNQANAALERLNDKKLPLAESVQIYRQGLEGIKMAREALAKARLELIQVDEELAAQRPEQGGGEDGRDEEGQPGRRSSNFDEIGNF